MAKQQCGEKTEQFIHHYKPMLKYVACRFSNQDHAHKFAQSMNRTRFNYEHTNPDDYWFDPNIALIIPLQPELLTTITLNEFITVANQYDVVKLRPNSDHKYCEIALKFPPPLNIVDSSGKKPHYIGKFPLHCPEFEKQLPMFTRTMRKSNAKLLRDFRKYKKEEPFHDKK